VKLKVFREKVGLGLDVWVSQKPESRPANITSSGGAGIWNPGDFELLSVKD
jgi:hypothetical protein